MVSLKDAIEAAQMDLRAIQAEGFNLFGILDMVACLLTKLPVTDDDSILLAKAVCECIVESAQDAKNAGNADIAERLHGVNRTLSLVVASSHLLLRPFCVDPYSLENWVC